MYALQFVYIYIYANLKLIGFPLDIPGSLAEWSTLLVCGFSVMVAMPCESRALCYVSLQTQRNHHHHHVRCKTMFLGGLHLQECRAHYIVEFVNSKSWFTDHQKCSYMSEWEGEGEADWEEIRCRRRYCEHDIVNSIIILINNIISHK